MAAFRSRSLPPMANHYHHTFNLYLVFLFDKDKIGFFCIYNTNIRYPIGYTKSQRLLPPTKGIVTPSFFSQLPRFSRLVLAAEKKMRVNRIQSLLLLFLLLRSAESCRSLAAHTSLDKHLICSPRHAVTSPKRRRPSNPHHSNSSNALTSLRTPSLPSAPRTMTVCTSTPSPVTPYSAGSKLRV